MSTVPYGLAGQDLDPGRNPNRFLSRKSATFLTLDPSHVQIFFNQGGQTFGQCPKLQPYNIFCLLLTKFRAIHQSLATLEDFKKPRKKAVCHRFNETGGIP